MQKQPAYPGDTELEQRIEDIHRWNAMAMVLQAYDSGPGSGGHIATYASAATMGLSTVTSSVARRVPGDLVCLGTDGYGLSESRPVIRDHFGVSAEYIIRAAGGEA